MQTLLAASHYEDHLSSFAHKSSESKGRKYRELPHPFRNPYQRDRDRVVHCRAFRRLEYKTQVLVSDYGDHCRTRLTHSIEVSMIARSIARALNIHEDLTEAIALAHDLGHPPFGHCGEEILDRLMKNEGGFEHNLQSLRIVDVLETRYPQFPGLNLTYEVRRGLVKHASFTSVRFLKHENFNLEETPFLEAQIVDVADALTYTCHDLEDGLTHGFIRLNDVKNLDIWNRMDMGRVCARKNTSEDIIVCHLTRSLIDFLVKDVVQTTRSGLRDNNIKSAMDICGLKNYIAGLSPDTRKAFQDLKTFLFKSFYKHPDIVKMTKKSGEILQSLFEYYIKNPSELPGTTYGKTRFRSLKRVVCDYIAGMTDRFAAEEYEKRKSRG